MAAVCRFVFAESAAARPSSRLPRGQALRGSARAPRPRRRRPRAPSRATGRRTRRRAPPAGGGRSRRRPTLCSDLVFRTCAGRPHARDEAGTVVVSNPLGIARGGLVEAPGVPTGPRAEPRLRDGGSGTDANLGRGARVAHGNSPTAPPSCSRTTTSAPRSARIRDRRVELDVRVDRRQE